MFSNKHTLFLVAGIFSTLARNENRVGILQYKHHVPPVHGKVQFKLNMLAQFSYAIILNKRVHFVFTKSKFEVPANQGSPFIV